MDNRKLLALTKALQGKPLHEVDRVLQEKHLDPQERLAVKVQIVAAATGRTLQAGVTLATDTAAYPPHPEARPRSGMDRLLDRVGVDRQRTYTEAELTELLAKAGITEPEQRLAVKLECQAQGLTQHPPEVYHLLDTLAIDRPIPLRVLEDRLDRLGIDRVALRTAVRTALEQRGLLAAGGRRTLRASSAPTPLVDRRRRSLTLRSRPA